MNSINKTEYMRPTSTDGFGKFFYDPIDDGMKVASFRSIYDVAINHDLFFSYIFSDLMDIPDNTTFITPIKRVVVSLYEIKSFSFDNNFIRNISLGINYNRMLYANQYLPTKIKEIYRNEILKYMENAIYNNTESFHIKNIPNIGTLYLNNVEKNGKEYIQSVKLIDRLTSRENKIGFVDYEIKFSYRTNRKFSNEEEFPVFIDSEGLCHPIRPLENHSLPEGDGIYIHKLTPSSQYSKNYIRLPLPDDVDFMIKAPILNGVFFLSKSVFKEIYKENFKSSYSEDNKFDDNVVFNIKKLVGNYLYNDNNINSYGLISHIIGFSLTTEKIYTCSPQSGINEIINVTPKLIGEDNFNNALFSVNLDRDLLIKNDYIIRKTNIGSGSIMVSPINTRHEKIKINKFILNQMRNSLMDNDLAFYNETGLALFSSREAAERCFNYHQGDISKFIEYINKKTVDKGVRNEILSNLAEFFKKNLFSIITSIGAIITTIIKLIFDFIKKEHKHSTNFVCSS